MPSTVEPDAPADNQLFRVIDENIIAVNLDAPPELPFDDAIVVTNSAGSWVTIQRRGNDLYQNGVKIILHLDDGQKNGKNIKGYKLQKKIANRTSVHPNVFDALFECNMMPDDYKVDEKGNTRFINSFAVVYRNRYGNEFVRCWFWHKGRWLSSYAWLYSSWRGRSPSALLAQVQTERSKSWISITRILKSLS
jgi:hypothetical protein